MPRGPERVALLTLMLGCAVICRAVTAADSPTATAPAGGAAMAPDLSTPLKAAQAMQAAINAGDSSAIRAATTNGTEGDYLAMKSWSAYFESIGTLHRAAVARFAAAATAAVFPLPVSNFDHEEAIETKIDGDNAVLLARANHKPMMYLARSNGLWRVDLGRSLDKHQQAEHAAEFRAMAKVMDRIAGEITDGQYATVQDAGTAMSTAIRSILQLGTGDIPLAREAPSTRSAVDSPPKSPIAGYDPKIVDAHREKYLSSSIPMAVELALKLTGRMPGDSFALQETWKDKHDGNFSEFDGKTIAGATFHHKFDQPRGNEFPTEDLFDAIDAELDHGRYVIISLYTGRNFALYVIVGRTANGDYHAVNKIVDQTFTVTNVKARVREMKGTDILTYTVGDPKDTAK
jgi:hypothetical protein